MNYPVNCKKCNQPLYGPVRYCPFCGVATISATNAPNEKTKKEKVKTPIAEKVVVTPPPIKEPEPEPEVIPPSPVEEKVEVKLPPIEKQNEVPQLPPPPPKPLFWKIALVVVVIAILVGFFYMNEGTDKTTTTSPSPTTGGEKIKPPKAERKQVGNKGLAATGTAALNAEREKIRQEAEREALAKVAAEKQRQEQAIRQQEIDDYLADGKRFFENAKYELCIEKMKEVIKRDSNNEEAKNYKQMSEDKIKEIIWNSAHPTVGRSE